MKNQIFDLFHINYILVPLGLTVLILWLAKKCNSIFYSLLGLGFIGLCVNIIFVLSGKPNPNAMYLQRPPLEEIPFLNGPVIAVLLIGTVFLIGYISELKLSKKISEAFV